MMTRESPPVLSRKGGVGWVFGGQNEREQGGGSNAYQGLDLPHSTFLLKEKRVLGVPFQITKEEHTFTKC